MCLYRSDGGQNEDEAVKISRLTSALNSPHSFLHHAPYFSKLIMATSAKSENNEGDKLMN